MVKTYNDALEWAAQWIEDTLKAGPETHERTVEFGTNMAMTLRAAKGDRADLPRATADDGALQDLFDLFERDAQGRWCFKSLSADASKLDRIMDRLAAPRATEGELTVEAVLVELRELFPDASFISAKTHAIYQRHWTHQPQATIQIEDNWFRYATLDEAVEKVRAWTKSRAEREGE
jgi:hypothetical protein